MGHGRLVLPLNAMLLSITLSSSHAATSNRIPIPIPSETFPGTTATPAGTCRGQDVATQSFQWFRPSDDYYYSFADPSPCCFGGTSIIQPHWTLFWPQTCSINIQVFVIAAIESPPGSGCYVPDHAAAPPDPEASFLGHSAIVSISGTGLVDHIAPDNTETADPYYWIPIGAKVFIVFKIVSNIDCPVSAGMLVSPTIVVDNTPDACTSYNGSLGNAPAEMTSSFGFPGNTTMWYEVVGCESPTVPSSWGKLKAHYR